MTIRELKKLLSFSDIEWTVKEHDILCMEHAVHLSAKHFVQTIAPTSPSMINKKIKAVLKKLSCKGNLDLDEFNKELAKIDLEVENEGDASNLLGKALALVKQFLEHFTFLRKGVDQFVLLTDESEEVPDLPKQHLYSDFKMLKWDWKQLDTMKEVLCELAKVWWVFSKVHSPTVWCIIPSLKYIIWHWESMISKQNFSNVKLALQQGVHNLKKWYCCVEDTSMAYFICLGM
ncbi:hypothetical protein BDQ17DRAFT_1326512 [Cyathus striatus]|nr:hypothetical protein BDQ17DRAFT_1326512 [Cyathus striatus]